MKVSSFWIGTDAKTAERCLELETFSITQNLCQQNKKGVKVNSEHPNRCSKSRACAEGVLPLEPLCQCSRHWGASWHLCRNHPGKAALRKSQPGCAFLAQGLPGQREGAAKENRFPFSQDFVSYVFDSTPSPCLHKHPGVELFELHSLVLLIYNSTASDKEKNSKCSAPFRQEESPWWQAGECVTCFSTTPWCTHTAHGAWEAPEKSVHRLTLSARELNLQLPLPELGAQSTKSRTSLEHLSCKLL